MSYFDELSNIDRITRYREYLETEPPSLEATAKKMVVDEILNKIMEGFGEPITVADSTYFKYMEYAAYAKDTNDGDKIFLGMAEEADYIASLCYVF